MSPVLWVNWPTTQSVQPLSRWRLGSRQGEAGCCCWENWDLTLSPGTICHLLDQRNNRRILINGSRLLHRLSHRTDAEKRVQPESERLIERGLKPANTSETQGGPLCTDVDVMGTSDPVKQALTGGSIRGGTVESGAFTVVFLPLSPPHLPLLFRPPFPAPLHSSFFSMPLPPLRPAPSLFNRDFWPEEAKLGDLGHMLQEERSYGPRSPSWLPLARESRLEKGGGGLGEEGGRDAEKGGGGEELEMEVEREGGDEEEIKGGRRLKRGDKVEEKHERR
ncbi:unnamed protein product [Pleuronectes platessa]|uniref:Uncharacterized protein n=1 Tax=Pleuronectes platessa TaxID=8262 RepID=A0A9N7U679_PLEPL|nr:unnamed protein product [Pleuronectes platessa]